MKPVAQCKVCKKTLSSEEIEVGTSLVCPRCDPTPAQQAKADANDSADSGTPKEEERD